MRVGQANIGGQRMTEAAAEASELASVSGARPGDAVAGGPSGRASFQSRWFCVVECSVSGRSDREPHPGQCRRAFSIGGAMGVVRARGGDWSGNGTQRSKSRRVWDLPVGHHGGRARVAVLRCRQARLSGRSLKRPESKTATLVGGGLCSRPSSGWASCGQPTFGLGSCRT